MHRLFRIIILLTLTLFYALEIYSQNIKDDSLFNKNIKDNSGFNIKNGFKKAKNKIIDISKDINAIDTCYISPNLYNLAFMVQHSSWHEQYKIGGDGQSIRFSPNLSYKFGIYFGWRWIFLGYTFDIKNTFDNNSKKSNKTELNLNLYTPKVGIDLFYRKTGNDYKIRSIKGFDTNMHFYETDFNGFRSYLKGLNVYWIFNHKHFSYPAVFSQSTNQRKSCGSVMAGVSVSEHKISFDYTELPQPIKNEINDSFKFKEIKYTDYSINVGYGYNWVFRKNWVANLSLLPAIAYKKSKIDNLQEEIEDHWIHNINFDLITRAGIVYNDSKYYVGSSLLIHSYNYKKYNYYISNSFGSLNIYVGFNFWKKKEYRQKQN